MPRDPAIRFASAIVVLGAAVLGAEAAAGRFSGIELTWSLPVLLAFVFLAETVELKVPMQRGDARVSSSTLFVFAMLVIHGAGPAILAYVAVSVVNDVAFRRLQPIKVAFNAAQLAVATAAAGWVYGAVPNVAGAVLAGATLLVTNHLLSTTVASLAMGISVRTALVRDTLRPMAIDATLLSFSPIVIVLADTHGLLLPLLLLPLWSITSSAREADRRRRDALHDPLTDLPNRRLFARQVDQELKLARDDRRCAVLLLDLARFKDINDTLGHRKGDEVLCSVAQRLRASLRGDDALARLNGDEFGVLVDGQDPAAAARRLRRVFDEPFLVGDLRLALGCTVGVATSLPGDDADAILRRADVAMYDAKETGAGVAVYDEAKDPNTPELLALAAELRDGIARGELCLHYQPKVGTADGRLAGVEALVRWQHPERGLLMPGAFLPLAERSGLMRPLTMAVLELAVGQAAAWRADGIDLHVAVNLSAETLLDHGLTEAVEELLARFELPTRCLQLELTESTLMRDPQRSAEILEHLAASGVRIAIDDFGTGWSSLVWLKRLPVHAIKIDRSFVGDMLDSPSDAAIVESTINLGRTLGLDVVAEGVETDETLAALRASGCDVVQGYLICRPKPADDVTAWMLERRDVARFARA